MRLLLFRRDHSFLDRDYLGDGFDCKGNLPLPKTTKKETYLKKCKGNLPFHRKKLTFLTGKLPVKKGGKGKFPQNFQNSKVSFLKNFRIPR